jgi:acetylornithine deacetylase/succinyl-diaminopimelate desuccinylase-like protein
VVIHASNRDLHSGMYGGSAMNPIRVLGKIIGDLHDERGRVTIPGFYDGVDDLPADIRAMWDGLGFDESRFLGEIGLGAAAGEQDHPGLPHIWSRPTAEVNGINGGYTGEGTKTVIPAKASAKFSFRLVFRQDPEHVIASFRDYVRARLPEDCRVEFLGGRGSPALVMAHDGRELGQALGALTDEWGKPAVVIGCGGSIPIVGAFRHVLGMDTVLVGFGLDDDRIHSPNEKYELKSFEKGARSWARILDRLATHA